MSIKSILPGDVIPGAGRNPDEEYGRYHLYKYVAHVCKPHVHNARCFTMDVKVEPLETFGERAAAALAKRETRCVFVCENADFSVEEPAGSGLFVCPKPMELLPMCPYGWNRCNGFAFSILRNNTRSCTECKLCAMNVAKDKPPAEPRQHKTKYI